MPESFLLDLLVILLKLLSQLYHVGASLLWQKVDRRAITIVNSGAILLAA